MDTLDEIRRQRLAFVCETFGGVKLVAARAGLTSRALEQVISAALSPPRKDGTRQPRALTTEAARKLEAAHRLSPGWLDWPLEGVDYNAWASLNILQQAYVQGRMQAAINDVGDKVPSTIKYVAGCPASDLRVEQHYPALPAGAAESARRRASTTSAVRRRARERRDGNQA